MADRAGKRPTPVRVIDSEGLPAAIDELAAGAPESLRFLRRAWYAAAARDDLRTLLAIRADGTPVAALPTRPAGPAFLGGRAVTGPYWPFRGVLISEDASDAELAALLSSGALPSAWRIGPVHRDAAIVRLCDVARGAGWTVLTRKIARSWLLDVSALRARGSWPRRSTLKKNRAHLRRLASEGEIAWRAVQGCGWERATFDAMTAIEQASWIATRTDRSGAKFLRPEQRASWERIVRDPVLAEMLRAIILLVNGRPVAFSLDLVCGDVQYGLASSYDPAFARFRVGRLVAWRQIEDAIAAGVTSIDWGAGDSGYKQEAGATPGALIEDHLLVRSAALAALLRPGWERRLTAGMDAQAPTRDDWEREAGGSLSPLVAGAAVAAVAALGGE